MLWGNCHNRVTKLQKKAIRIVCLEKYNAHTEPLFKSLNVLKVEDIFKLNQLKFYYKFINKKVPVYFNTFPLYPNHDIHDYNTRGHNKFHRLNLTHTFAKMSLRNTLITTLNNTPSIIIDKVNTHSQIGYSLYIKNVFVQEYRMTCIIPNCYICKT